MGRLINGYEGTGRRGRAAVRNGDPLMTVLVDELAAHDAPTPPSGRSLPPWPEILPLPAPRGPVSQGVVDLLTGRRADVVPVDVSTGPSGHVHDADVHTALWILNAAQVVALDGVDPDCASSLRARTLHWFLEQAVHDQLRREVAVPEPPDLRALVSRTALSSPPRLPGRARALAAVLSVVETPLQPLIAAAQRASSPEGVMAVPVDVPACVLARSNAMWLFARDRRLRGAAIGVLCLGPGADVPASAELVGALEQCTPWLVRDVAWGAALDVALSSCAERCARGARTR